MQPNNGLFSREKRFKEDRVTFTQQDNGVKGGKKVMHVTLVYEVTPALPASVVFI